MSRLSDPMLRVLRGSLETGGYKVGARDAATIKALERRGLATRYCWRGLVVLPTEAGWRLVREMDHERGKAEEVRYKESD